MEVFLVMAERKLKELKEQQIQSVKKPGVIKSNPEISKKIPPLISFVGITPSYIFCRTLKSKLMPLLLATKIFLLFPHHHRL